MITIEKLFDSIKYAAIKGHNEVSVDLFNIEEHGISSVKKLLEDLGYKVSVKGKKFIVRW